MAWEKVDEFIRSFPLNKAEAKERTQTESANRSIIGEWNFDKKRTDEINGEEFSGVVEIKRVRFFEMGSAHLEETTYDRSIEPTFADWRVLTKGEKITGQLIHYESRNGPKTGRTTTFEIDIRPRLDNQQSIDEYLYLGDSPRRIAFVKVGWPAAR